ncbi:MAG: DUF2238 domain-containing protein [Candidatus Binatia bacterium]|nr:DUF2238 domain-containing protein [Candidatus Binatia bacterium]
MECTTWRLIGGAGNPPSGRQGGLFSPKMGRSRKEADGVGISRRCVPAGRARTARIALRIGRRFRFSDISYGMMAVLIYTHTIGGHYTFERVPLGLVTDLFGFERNHYDRVAHFSVGLYAYPMAELLFRKKLARATWVVLLFPVATIFSVAAIYEIIEWIYADLEGGASGVVFLA